MPCHDHLARHDRALRFFPALKAAASHQQGIQALFGWFQVGCAGRSFFGREKK
jgi:hypothetical protein